MNSGADGNNPIPLTIQEYDGYLEFSRLSLFGKKAGEVHAAVARAAAQVGEHESAVRRELERSAPMATARFACGTTASALRS